MCITDKTLLTGKEYVCPMNECNDKICKFIYVLKT